MDYFKKYITYKTKYLQLKKQLGGVCECGSANSNAECIRCGKNEAHSSTAVENTIKIYISMMSGKTNEYNVSPNATIKDLKRLIQQNNEMHPSIYKQALILRSVQLEPLANERTIAECGIINGSSLDLLLVELPEFNNIIIDQVVALIRTNSIDLVDLLSQYTGELNLEDKEITDAHMVSLCSALGQNNTVTSLNLSSNEFSLDGITELVKLLKINNTITTLNLGYNHLNNELIEILVDGLIQNNTITTLDLSANDFDMEGIVKLLNHNTPITTLNLSNNYINDKKATLLADPLIRHTFITNLILRDNYISREGKTILTTAKPSVNIDFRRKSHRHRVFDSNTDED